MQKKMLFVYNPVSGKGEIRTWLSHILEEFARHNFLITVHPTQKAGDASRVVRETGRRYDVIVCSGGDGTLDEVVAGVMHGGFQVPVGYIPAGSTNDFASSLGLPKQMQNAAATICHGEVFNCDVGSLNEEYFIYVAAFGIFTEVSYQTNQDLKNVLGHVAYLMEGMRSLPNMKSVKIAYKSKEASGSGDFLYGMVTNSNSVGGFKGITGKDVTLNDGLFEVTLIKMPEYIWEWPVIANALLNHTPNDKLISFKTSKLEIEYLEKTGELAWTTDGEYGGSYRRAVIENSPKALQIIVDPEREAEESAGSVGEIRMPAGI